MMMLDKTKPFTVQHQRKDAARYLQDGILFRQDGRPFGMLEVEQSTDKKTVNGNMLTFSNHVQENKPLPVVVEEKIQPKHEPVDIDALSAEYDPEAPVAGDKEEDSNRVHSKPEQKTDGKFRLCLADARNIRREHQEGASVSALMRNFNSSRQAINKILAGTTLAEPNIPDHIRDKAGRDFREQATIDMLPPKEEGK